MAKDDKAHELGFRNKLREGTKVTHSKRALRPLKQMLEAHLVRNPSITCGSKIVDSALALVPFFSFPLLLYKWIQR